MPIPGQNMSKGSRQVTVQNYGEYANLPQFLLRRPQGKLVVAEFVAKNLMDHTSNFTPLISSS